MMEKDNPLDDKSKVLNAEGLAENKEYSLWRDALARLLANKMSVISLVLVTILILMALVGPYITPYDFLDQDIDSRNQPPTWAHWMGSDNLGRDILSRIIYGARTATVSSFAVVGVSVLNWDNLRFNSRVCWWQSRCYDYVDHRYGYGGSPHVTGAGSQCGFKANGSGVDGEDVCSHAQSRLPSNLLGRYFPVGHWS